MRIFYGLLSSRLISYTRISADYTLQTIPVVTNEPYKCSPYITWRPVIILMRENVICQYEIFTKSLTRSIMTRAVFALRNKDLVQCRNQNIKIIPRSLWLMQRWVRWKIENLSRENREKWSYICHHSHALTVYSIHIHIIWRQLIFSISPSINLNRPLENLKCHKYYHLVSSHLQKPFYDLSSISLFMV